MPVLHLLSNPQAAGSCLAAAADGDAVLLLGDGVFAHHFAENGDRALLRFGVLQDDATSRGVGPPAAIEALTYDGFVEWVATCSHTVTWR